MAAPTPSPSSSPHTAIASPSFAPFSTVAPAHAAATVTVAADAAAAAALSPAPPAASTALATISVSTALRSTVAASVTAPWSTASHCPITRLPRAGRPATAFAARFAAPTPFAAFTPTILSAARVC